MGACVSDLLSFLFLSPPSLNIKNRLFSSVTYSLIISLEHSVPPPTCLTEPKRLPHRLPRPLLASLCSSSEYILWKASNGETNQVLTTPFIDGLVLRSGGSTNIPKTVLMTHPEFHLTSQINGVLMAETSGLLPGDRVANLSAQGGMYSGFMTFGYTVMNCPIPIVNLPISGSEALKTIAKLLMDFKATVIISKVCISTRLSEHLQCRKLSLPGVRRILFTGEAFYKDLRSLHRSVFPNVRIRPLSYGSVQLKIIAFPLNRPGDDEDADVNPLYKVNSSSVIMEILDSDGKVIKENGKHGLVVGTNLLMKLQRKIRYPVGDSAEWVDYDAGTFRFRGRESVGLKIGNAHLACQSIRKIVSSVLEPGSMVTLQTVVRRSDRQNVVTIRIAAEEPETSSDIRTRIEEEIMKTSPA
jgi:phenylacetate-CoA ligase